MHETINWKNSRRSINNEFDFIDRCACGMQHSTWRAFDKHPAREGEIRLPFTREIESTRPGFFVKLKIYANQRRSIERAAVHHACSRTLPHPARRGVPFHGRKFNFCHFARTRNTTSSGSFPVPSHSSIVNSRDLKKACRVFPPSPSPLSSHSPVANETFCFLLFFWSGIGRKCD